jgi:hypothetical protein
MGLSYEQYTSEPYLNGFRLPLGQILDKINQELKENELADCAATAKSVRGLANMAIALVDQVVGAGAEALKFAESDQDRAHALRNDATAAMMQLMAICELVQTQYMTYQIQAGQKQPPVIITDEDLSPHRTIN